MLVFLAGRGRGATPHGVHRTRAPHYRPMSANRHATVVATHAGAPRNPSRRRGPAFWRQIGAARGGWALSRAPMPPRGRRPLPQREATAGPGQPPGRCLCGSGAVVVVLCGNDCHRRHRDQIIPCPGFGGRPGAVYGRAFGGPQAAATSVQSRGYCHGTAAAGMDIPPRHFALLCTACPIC